MATRSIIGIKRPHQIDSIWCRSDGYPKGKHSVGETLNTHYTDPKKVLELVSYGDIDQLYPDLEDIIRLPGGDPTFTTYENLSRHIRLGAIYFYLFDTEHGLWLFSRCYPPEKLNFKDSGSILSAYINGVVCGDPSTYQLIIEEQWVRIQLEEEDNDHLENYQGGSPAITKARITEVHDDYPGDELCESDDGRHDICCHKSDIENIDLNDEVLVVIWPEGSRVIPIPKVRK